MQYEATAYLCGHFTRCCETDVAALTALGWQREAVDTPTLEHHRRLFYPEFVDFCYSAADGSDRGSIAFTRQADDRLTIDFKGRTYNYRLSGLTIYLMPLNMVLFSIGVEMSGNDLNALTAVLFSLRSIDSYRDNVHRDFISHAIAPLQEVYRLLTGTEAVRLTQLVENGNKLRTYQVVNCHGETGLSDDGHTRRLYQMATLSPVTQPGQHDEYEVAEAYLTRVMERGRLSVFHNWDALALMDTFTVYLRDVSEALAANWKDIYFRTIYLHALFQKCYLFSLNTRFRESLRQSSPSVIGQMLPLRGGVKGATLSEEYESFERWCCFHKISYNFLPLELAAAIDNALEIGEEQALLHDMLEREKTRRDEANDRMVNTLLFCLSLLTLFSAIWDLSCLLDQLYPYADYIGDTISGYRWVTSIVLLLLALLIYVLFRRKRR